MAATPNLKVTEGQAGLHVVNLRKSYRKKTVIRDVSIDLGRGEVVALLAKRVRQDDLLLRYRRAGQP